MICVISIKYIKNLFKKVPTHANVAGTWKNSWTWNFFLFFGGVVIYAVVVEWTVAVINFINLSTRSLECYKLNSAKKTILCLMRKDSIFMVLLSFGSRFWNNSNLPPNIFFLFFSLNLGRLFFKNPFLIEKLFSIVRTLPWRVLDY